MTKRKMKRVKSVVSVWGGLRAQETDEQMHAVGDWARLCNVSTPPMRAELS